MFRPLLSCCIVAICLVTHGSLSFAQERNVAPYLGASGDFGGDGGPGWGVETGVRFPPFFYAGLEYGILYPIQRVNTVLYLPGYIAPPGPVSNSIEQYWGIHVGYVFPHDSTNHSSTFLGIVVLNSYQPWERYDSVSGWVQFTKSFLNIGPDLRFSSFDDGHIYLDLAFTIRRGFKAGLGYMF